MELCGAWVFMRIEAARGRTAHQIGTARRAELLMQEGSAALTASSTMPSTAALSAERIECCGPSLQTHIRPVEAARALPNDPWIVMSLGKPPEVIKQSLNAALLAFDDVEGHLVWSAIGSETMTSGVTQGPADARFDCLPGWNLLMTLRRLGEVAGPMKH